MYAYINETGREFFEGVCAPSNATTHSCDPPHPALCTGTKLALLSAPIIHANMQHDLLPWMGPSPTPWRNKRQVPDLSLSALANFREFTSPDVRGIPYPAEIRTR
jgi:hypothetical protein